jgi:hypothetical protein
VPVRYIVALQARGANDVPATVEPDLDINFLVSVGAAREPKVFQGEGDMDASFAIERSLAGVRD